MTSTALQLEQRICNDTRELLLAATQALVPVSVQYATGLAQWVRTLARHIVRDGGGPLRVDDAIRLAYNISLTGTAFTNRFSRAELVTPNQFVLAYRVAAIGALLGHGADAKSAAKLVGLASTAGLYRTLSVCEARLNSPLTAAALAEVAHREPPITLFRRYVTPILPLRADAVWQVSLLPSTSGATP